MKRITHRRMHVACAGLVGALLLSPAVALAQNNSDLLKDALSAAWPGMGDGAKVVDWEGNVLKEGSNGYVCLPATGGRATSIRMQRARRRTTSGSGRVHT